MPCPNCDRTLAGLVDAPVGQRKFWCQYCGLLLLESGDVQTVDIPTLIKHPAHIPEVAELLTLVEGLFSSLKTGMGVIAQQGIPSHAFNSSAEQTSAVFRDLKVAAKKVREK